MRAHQITYGMMPGDAISTHALEIDARLRAWGYQTTLYAHHIAPELTGRVCPDTEFLPHLGAKDDLLIYHYSIYSPNVRFFQAARGRRLLIYHNITPPHFFRRWDATLALQCQLGRLGLGWLADGDWSVGDSDFNRQELIKAGFPAEKTGILPIFLPQSSFQTRSVNDGLRLQLRKPGMINWLTVGRVVPNKAIEDIIRIFYLYNHYINSVSHLYIVGSRYLPQYDAQLEALVAALGLATHVTFAGRVTEADLAAYYQAADLYLVASHHEGFCVPVIESMYFGVPVLARNATATPETLGEAGVLFNHLGYEQVAEMAHLLVSDQVLRAQVIRKQRERLQDFDPKRTERALSDLLHRLGLPGGETGAA